MHRAAAVLSAGEHERGRTLTNPWRNTVGKHPIQSMVTIAYCHVSTRLSWRTTRSPMTDGQTTPDAVAPQVEPYFQAWNAHDPEEVAAAFADGGTYTDPTVTGPPLTGSAVAEHARALFAGFPDLSFEILSAQPVNGAGGTVMAQWLMRGGRRRCLRLRPAASGVTGVLVTGPRAVRRCRRPGRRGAAGGAPWPAH